jgi:acetyltransferase
MFGAGGILVELISDFATAVGPFDSRKVKDLINKTKVSKIIRGYRSNTKYSEQKLIDALLSVGHLITDHPEIKSVEINPLILEDSGRGMLGLDAKISLQNDSEKN